MECAEKSSKLNVYLVSILFLNRVRLTKLFHKNDVGNGFQKPNSLFICHCLSGNQFE